LRDDIRMGQLFGIEIFISYSWFFIFALVTVALAFGFFPMQFPQHTTAVNIGIGMFASAVFFGSLLFHELSHSFVANRNQIPIRKITLFIFGGMSQMTKEPDDPAAELKMAIAGPLSSFFLAVLFFGVFQGMLALGVSSILYAAFAWLAQINLLLAVFNLVPGFPLDGGRVLRATVWHFTKSIEQATNVASKAGQGFAFLLIGFGLLLFLGGQLGGIWLVLIGWFLNQSAVGSFRQVMLQRALQRVNVEEIMTPEPKVEKVGRETTLDELVNHYFLRYRFGRFPVTANGSLLGVVTLHDVKEVPREQWSTVTAGQIVEKIEESMFVKPQDPAVKALMKMADEDVGHLLVMDEQGKLDGIITRTDILRLVRVKDELGD
jgi:Zn-dependent protease/CBS domain-containing protein